MPRRTDSKVTGMRDASKALECPTDEEVLNETQRSSCLAEVLTGGTEVFTAAERVPAALCV